MAIKPQYVAIASLGLARQELNSESPRIEAIYFNMGRLSATHAIEPTIETLSAINECKFLLSYGHRHNLFEVAYHGN